MFIIKSGISNLEPDPPENYLWQFLEKNTIFVNLKKMSRFGQFFNIQMAIFRGVILGHNLTGFNTGLDFSSIAI